MRWLCRKSETRVEAYLLTSWDTSLLHQLRTASPRAWDVSSSLRQHHRHRCELWQLRSQSTPTLWKFEIQPEMCPTFITFALGLWLLLAITTTRLLPYVLHIHSRLTRDLCCACKLRQFSPVGDKPLDMSPVLGNQSTKKVDEFFHLSMSWRHC